MSKKIIAVDNDDVLFQLVDSIFDYYNHTYNTSYSIKDQTVFNLETTFGLSEAETMERIFDFYKSKYLLTTKPMPQAFNILKKLKQTHDLVLVTARPTFTKKVTLKALKEHFPDIFQSVYLTNAFSLTGKKKLKSEICMQVGASLIIDDAFHNVTDCAEKGIPAILFRRPWNEKITKSDLKGKPIYPADNWQEVYQLISSLTTNH